MKKSLFGLVALLVLLAGGAVALSECSGDVVVLHTRNAEGRDHATLWVVEREEHLWLRAGARPTASPTSWFARLRAHPEVELERDGVRRAYRAVLLPEEEARLDRLMAERYGLANRIILAFRKGARSTPVRLDSVTP